MNLPVKYEGQIINPPAILTAGVSVAPGATTVTAARFDASENITQASGTSVPGAEAGYAKGCVFIKTDTANGSANTYVNIGDATTANFQLGTAVTAMSYVTDAAATKSANNRIYTGSVTGTLQVGETVTQATSTATAVIVAKGTGYIDVNTVTGTWDATHLATGGTSGATFTPTMTLIDVWTPTYPPKTPIIGSKSGTQYTQVNSTTLLATTKFRFLGSAGKIESLTSDAISTFNLEYGA